MITLKMPSDVRLHVLKVQGKVKAEKGLGQFSQQQTIILIVREHMQNWAEEEQKEKSSEEPEETTDSP